MDTNELSELEKRLIDDFQQKIPVCPRPYLQMAEQLGCSEEDVINALSNLKKHNVLSRVGPVFNHSQAGASVLAAMAVEEENLDAVAEKVNAFDGVNHNYAREHKFNLWFVVTASDQQQLQLTLDAIEKDCGYAVMPLPMLKKYFIDLGFKVRWN